MDLTGARNRPIRIISLIRFSRGFSLETSLRPSGRFLQVCSQRKRALINAAFFISLSLSFFLPRSVVGWPRFNNCRIDIISSTQREGGAIVVSRGLLLQFQGRSAIDVNIRSDPSLCWCLSANLSREIGSRGGPCSIKWRMISVESESLLSSSLFARFDRDVHIYIYICVCGVRWTRPRYHVTAGWRRVTAAGTVQSQVVN